MRKGMIRFIGIDAIICAIYVLFMFMLPIQHTGIFWISFAFTLISIVIGALAWFISFVNTPNIKSKIYGFPIVRIGTGYAVIQIVLGFLFSLVQNHISIIIPVLIYAFLLGAASVGLITAKTYSDELYVVDEALKDNVQLMRTLQSKVSSLRGLCNDPETAKVVRKFSDEIRYSDPVSSEALHDTETELVAMVDELYQAVIDADQDRVIQFCRKASILLAERNRLCKLNK